jgi:hypothetical protein
MLEWAGMICYEEAWPTMEKGWPGSGGIQPRSAGSPGQAPISSDEFPALTLKAASLSLIWFWAERTWE